jgi:aryl-alcohol dehydrogenase-like predicted oxidoreductase
MRYVPLSTTDISVSTICLGTMGYGYQISEEDAHEQLDYALTQGVNFIDTAEMYPIPPTAERFGRTEDIIGRWFQKSGKRKEIVLATKISGPTRYVHIRGAKGKYTEEDIISAIDASLLRLKTEYIDLYQLHWPQRNVNMFGQRGYVHNPSEEMTPIDVTLKALEKAQKEGKIRAIGLSNETPWGVMEFLRVAREQSLPRMVSVQNGYNLLNRHYDIALAEVSMREQIGLLAYSPLAYGVLGGRYLRGEMPEGGRFTLHPEAGIRYRTPQSFMATEQYESLAHRHGLSLAQMCLAFVQSQPFVTSTIIGASTMDQLQEDIATVDLTLPSEVIKEIDLVHEKMPNLCC